MVTSQFTWRQLTSAWVKFREARKDENEWRKRLTRIPSGGEAKKLKKKLKKKLLRAIELKQRAKTEFVEFTSQIRRSLGKTLVIQTVDDFQDVKKARKYNGFALGDVLTLRMSISLAEGTYITLRGAAMRAGMKLQKTFRPNRMTATVCEIGFEVEVLGLEVENNNNNN